MALPPSLLALAGVVQDAAGLPHVTGKRFRHGWQLVAVGRWMRHQPVKQLPIGRVGEFGILPDGPLGNIIGKALGVGKRRSRRCRRGNRPRRGQFCF